MREWYKNNFHGKYKKKSKILYYLLPIWLIIVFYVGRTTFKKQEEPEPKVISQKLTSSILDMNLNERLNMYHYGTDEITYIVEATVTNTGKAGFISIDASFDKNNNTINQSETFEIKNMDTIKTKFYFKVPFLDGVKRTYSVSAKPVTANQDLSIKNL